VKRRAAIASAFAACLGGCGRPPVDAPPRPQWPELSVREIGGAPATVPAVTGSPRVINMWAMWCAPCRAELPALQRLAGAMAPQGIAVSAVALADDLFAVREYLAQHAAALPGAILSPAQPVVRALGLNALPQTFLVAGDGRIAACWVGARDWDDAAVRADLVRHLKGA
jgi:thiol-disulfide isomerase/thioredoxin